MNFTSIIPSITPSINNANKALEAASSYVETQPEVTKSSLKSKSIHWSFYATLGLGTLGAITSVASTILFNFGITLIGAGISMLGCIFAIIFIHKLSEYQTLQTYSDLLANRVVQLVSRVSVLQKAVNNINTVGSSLSDVTTIQGQIYEQTTTSMKAHTEEISKLTHKIAEQETHLKKWDEICQQMKQTEEGIYEQNRQLSEENKLMKDEHQKLIKQIELLQVAQSKLAVESLALEKVSQKLEGNRLGLSHYEKQLSHQVDALSHINLLASDKQLRFREDIHKFTQSTHTLNQSASLLGQQAPEVRAVTQELREQCERLQPLLELLDQRSLNLIPSALSIYSPHSLTSQPGQEGDNSDSLLGASTLP